MAGDALAWILGHLRAAEVPHQLCGGLAAKAYGAQRPLADVDFFVDMRLLRERLEPLGVVAAGDFHREDGEEWRCTFGRIFHGGQQIEFGCHATTEIRDRASGAWIPQVIDFAASRVMTVEGVEGVPVMPRAQLVAYKRQLDRLVDRVDVAQMTGREPFPERWVHGAEGEEELQEWAFDADTLVLRQSKRLHYEGNFLFLLCGSERALLLDTGAVEGYAPLAERARALAAERGLELVFAHTHMHDDHCAADALFAADHACLDGAGALLDLGGGRELDVLPTPGHDPTHVALYDRRTGLLLTGDTLYPGRLYVRDWPAFCESVERLAAWAETHVVTWVLGTHVEMTREPGVEYATGERFQPDECALQLHAGHLFELRAALRRLPGPAREVHARFVLEPVE